MSDTLHREAVPGAGLRILVRRFDGGVTVELHGELDITTAAALDTQMRALCFQYDADQVTIDLTRLDFIDLHGTTTLKRAARMSGHNGRLTLRGTPPMLDVLLQVAGCTDVFILARP